MPLIRLAVYTTDPMACQQVGNCGCFEFLYMHLSDSPCSPMYAVGNEMQPTKPIMEGLIRTSPGCDYYVLLLLSLLLPRGSRHL